MLLRNLTFLLLLSFCLPASAGTQLLKEFHRDAGNTEVRIESVFGVAAQQGSLPFRITIRNDSGQDRVWTVRLNDGGYNRTLITRWSGEIAVDDGQEVVQEVTLPFASRFAAYQYRNVDVTFSSSGLNTINRSTGYQINNDYPTLALSEKLGSRSLAKLDKIVERKGTSDQRFGESFDPAHLPSDWKAYTGLDALLIDLPTWRSLPGAPRRAILEWLRLGGKLDVYVPSKSFKEASLSDLGIEGLKPEDSANHVAWLSLGEVQLREWNGTELASSAVRDYESLQPRSLVYNSEFRDNWPLNELLGDKPFNSLLIFGILLTFAILVAPVNLFYFARKGHRHRLFYTTPIISIAACLIIVLLIFIGDGLGGKGFRVALIDLQAAASERRMFITQQQLSRTGVIVDTGFESEKDISIEPVRTRDSAFAAFNRSSGRSTSYLFGSGEFRGGFFRSRSEQGFTLMAVEPTRARIEVKPASAAGDPPTLTSSLPGAVGDFFVYDANLKIWKASPGTVTEPGGTFSLEPTKRAELITFLAEHTEGFSPSMKAQVMDLPGERGRFFAIPQQTTPYLLETHPGIRWTDEGVILTGTLEDIQSPEPIAAAP